MGFGESCTCRCCLRWVVIYRASPFRRCVCIACTQARMHTHHLSVVPFTLAPSLHFSPSPQFQNHPSLFLPLAATAGACVCVPVCCSCRWCVFLSFEAWLYCARCCGGAQEVEVDSPPTHTHTHPHAAQTSPPGSTSTSAATAVSTSTSAPHFDHPGYVFWGRWLVCS